MAKYWKGLYLLIILILVKREEGQLVENFYSSSCPNVESIVRQAVATKFNQTFITVPGTLRLFFHDCFVEGCDASVLIASSNNDAEKDAPDNLSLVGDGFDTVVKAKQAVEAQCPFIVSCADILAIAARDVVVLLMQECPQNVDHRIAINMDPATPQTFDNVYYQNLVGGKGLFTSDQTLTNALCNELGKEELKLHSKVLELSCSCGENSPLDNWSVSYELDQRKHLDEKSFDAVIVTAPLSDVKGMKIMKRGSLLPLDFIPEVSYLPLSVIVTTFKRENVKRPLEGFGVLIPSKEQQNGLNTLGTLFSSSMFPDRAPNDVYLYTTFIGGSRNRELAKASRDELKQIVTSDLRQLLGAEGEPAFLNHFYWSKAFPLYGKNYDLVIKAIDKMERDLPGFFYAGNHKGGLSVGKAIASGCHAADLVISYLDSSSNEKENFS
ncbi:Protoporphyrinogen oxidase [Forsythia ovata]|uniref:peroxidase n=1 Tax=Forsythia ovata TaxID=205694 RepID=A0ABD1UDV7_9LAMI